MIRGMAGRSKDQFSVLCGPRLRTLSLDPADTGFIQVGGCGLRGFAALITRPFVSGRGLGVSDTYLLPSLYPDLYLYACASSWLGPHNPILLSTCLRGFVHLLWLPVIDCNCPVHVLGE